MDENQKMFWFACVAYQRPFTVKERKGFHVSQAVLQLEPQLETCEATDFTLWARFEDKNIPLANLSLSNSQVRLDLAFGSNDEVTFFVDGTCTIFLAGYYLEVTCSESGESPPKKRKPLPPSPVFNAGVIETTPTTPKATRFSNRHKQNKLMPNSSIGGINDPIGTSDNSIMNDYLDDFFCGEYSIPSDAGVTNEQSVQEDVCSMPVNITPAKAKRQRNLNVTPKNASATKSGFGNKPGTLMSKTNALVSNTTDNNRVLSDLESDTNIVEESMVQQITMRSQALREKLTYDDTFIGTGAKVQKTSTVVISLVGRLESTQVQVFKNESLKFKIGSTSVPRGLSLAVLGMAIGSERVIRCPPSFGYGVEGLPPNVPPDATLIFDVILRNILK